MSTYNGRRGPNVSQYLRDLNTISPQDTTPAEENFAEETDLSLFTNTQFFDFDSGQNTDYQAQPQPQPVKREGKVPAQSTTTSDDVGSGASIIGDVPAGLDFMPGDFNFGDFTNGYPAPSLNAFSAEGPQNFPPLQPNHGAVYGNQVGQSGQFPQNGAGEKRKSESMGTPVSFEDASRHAAEEDKRRRNTAASARFRIKKKQREQALEKSAKEMTDKVTNLENKVSQLETENKWLKNLLVEKNEGNEEISTLWKEFTKQASEKRGSGKATKADR